MCRSLGHNRASVWWNIFQHLRCQDTCSSIQMSGKCLTRMKFQCLTNVFHLCQGILQESIAGTSINFTSQTHTAPTLDLHSVSVRMHILAVNSFCLLQLIAVGLIRWYLLRWNWSLFHTMIHFWSLHLSQYWVTQLICLCSFTFSMTVLCWKDISMSPSVITYIGALVRLAGTSYVFVNGIGSYWHVSMTVECISESRIDSNNVQYLTAAPLVMTDDGIHCLCGTINDPHLRILASLWNV